MMIWEGLFSNFLESLIAWVRKVAVNVKLCLKHHRKNFDVKNSVINYQNVIQTQRIALSLLSLEEVKAVSLDISHSFSLL